MINWVIDNKQWLFSGAGLLLITGFLGIVQLGYARWRSLKAESVLAGLSSVEYKRVASPTFQSRLPRILLRVMLKPNDVAGRVHIALREATPIACYLQNPIPQLDLYFTITNLGPLDLVLDRLLIEVWFGQPTFTTTLLRQHFVPAGEITQGITVRQFLTSEQKAQIETFYSTPMSGTLHIYLVGYFKSPIGDLIVSRPIEMGRT